MFMQALLRKRVSISTITSALVLLLGSSPSVAGYVLSFNDDANVVHELTYSGVATTAGSVLKLEPPEVILVETELFGAIPEDVNATHLLENGHILFSTTTVGYIAGVPFQGGDIGEWDPVNKTASLFLSRDIFDAIENIDAAFVYESGPDAGKILLSTQAAATINGLDFTNGDLILYDPIGHTAVRIFDDASMTGTAAQKNIDGLHVLRSGRLILSFAASNGSIGGLTIKAEDLVRYDLLADEATVELPGQNLFDGVTANLNAVSAEPPVVPALEPSGTTLLLTVLMASGAWLLHTGWARRGMRSTL
jgi:hypothetical protein